MGGPWLETTLRLGGALLAGGVIGAERQVRGRPAGLRTHMLVSLGAAMMVAVPFEMKLGDPTRVIQGVATGIGFLCAGDILHQVRAGQEIVKGLTSAAALWVTAGLGMAAAAGLWDLAVIGTIATLVVLTVAHPLEKLIPKRDDSGDGPASPAL